MTEAKQKAGLGRGKWPNFDGAKGEGLSEGEVIFFYLIHFLILYKMINFYLIYIFTSAQMINIYPIIFLSSNKLINVYPIIIWYPLIAHAYSTIMLNTGPIYDKVTR